MDTREISFPGKGGQPYPKGLKMSPPCTQLWLRFLLQEGRWCADAAAGAGWCPNTDGKQP